MLCGHAICSLEMEYAVWTCYMSSGDGICCIDMVYGSVYFVSGIVPWAPGDSPFGKDRKGLERTGKDFGGSEKLFFAKIDKNVQNH